MGTTVLPSASADTLKSLSAISLPLIKLRSRLAKLIKPDTDSVRCYFLCGCSQRKVKTYWQRIATGRYYFIAIKSNFNQKKVGCLPTLVHYLLNTTLYRCFSSTFANQHCGIFVAFENTKFNQQLF